MLNQGVRKWSFYWCLGLKHWLPELRLCMTLDPHPQLLNYWGKMGWRHLEPAVHFPLSPTVNGESLGQAPMCVIKAVFLDLQVD